MTLLIGAIADDFTGATDLANTLVKQGMRVRQMIGIPPADQGAGDAQAIVIALKSRTAPVEDAVADSLAALTWLQAQGARQILFKYCSTFDSTPQGNIGPVADALSDALGAQISVMCPAFPTTGRTIYKGKLFVGDQPLHESPMKDHPLTPMTDADLPRLMGAQSRYDTGLIPWQTVCAGPDAVRTALSDLAAVGARYAVTDTLQDQDLMVLGQAIGGDALITGGSGIALGLPDYWRAAGALAPAAPPTLPQGYGRALCVAGSCSVATRGQVAAAERVMPTARVDIPALMTDGDEVARLTQWALDQEGPVLIVASADPEQVARDQVTYGAAALGTAIEGCLAQIAVALTDQGFGRLVVAGGETSGAVVSALGLTTLDIGPEIDPGVPWCGAGNLAITLKSGNFGAPDFFTKAIEMLG